MTIFDELDPPYSTIVVDPPWHYDLINQRSSWPMADGTFLRGPKSRPLEYQTMTLDEINALPVAELATDSRVYLWVTNKYLRHSWDVLEAWGAKPDARTFVWCKPRRATQQITTEYIISGKIGKPPPIPWHGTTWFDWPRQRGHSQKPAQFLDLVEQWSPGPYVELFARAPRLGWDSWGHGFESVAS